MCVIRFIILAAMVLCTTVTFAQNNPTANPDSLPIFQQNGKPIIFLPSVQNGQFTLSRSVGNPGGIDVPLNLQGKAKTPDELVTRLGAGLADSLKSFVKKQYNSELWPYFSTHDNIADYGVFALDLKLMSALGRVVIDDLAGQKAGTVVYYRLLFKGGGKQLTFTGRFVVGRPLMPKPVNVSHSQVDTVATLKWAFINRTDQPAPLSANLYLKLGNDPLFKKKRTPVYLSKNKDSVIFKVKYNVVAGNLYSFYIRTLDFLGNENSATSDTISVYAMDMRPMPIIKNLTSADTTGGIFLKWEKINTGQAAAGLVIERSETRKGTFKILDTIASDATFFTDKKVADGKNYFYQVYYIGYAKVPEPGFKSFTFNTHVNHNPLIAPYGVTASAMPKKIAINWQTVEGAAGYYVYRGSTSDSTKMTCISRMLSDTASQFVDTTKRLSRRSLYYYAVRACNLRGKPGQISLLAAVRPITDFENVISPGNLELALADGGMRLSWSDVKVLDPYVIGYNIYRTVASGRAPQVSQSKPAAMETKKSHFGKLNGSPIRGTTFSDSLWVDTVNYRYAISAVDIDGFESALSAPVSASFLSNAPSQFNPPVQVTVTKMKKGGAELRWSVMDNLHADMHMVIYRRSGADTKAVAIGTVYNNVHSFFDATAKTGNIYRYQIAVVRGEKKGPLSKEAVVKL